MYFKIVLQTREISERRHQCLSITWYGWKCAHESQLVSHMVPDMSLQWITQR